MGRLWCGLANRWSSSSGTDQLGAPRTGRGLARRSSRELIACGAPGPPSACPPCTEAHARCEARGWALAPWWPGPHGLLVGERTRCAVHACCTRDRPVQGPAPGV